MIALPIHKAHHYGFWFYSLGNEDLLGDYKPFPSDPSCTSNAGQTFVRGCNEDGARHAD